MIEKVQKALDEHVRNNSECGCQLAVYKNGVLLCNLSSGFLDRTKKVKVTSQTLFPVFSAGKSVLTTLCHILVKEKLFSFDDRVCDYWPEFAQNGKENITVRNILSHRAALWAFPADFPYEDYYCWEKACRELVGATTFTGGVWEWCLDSCWREGRRIITHTYYGDMQDPFCEKGNLKIKRGGSGYHGNEGSGTDLRRAAARAADSPYAKDHWSGFRVAVVRAE